MTLALLHINDQALQLFTETGEQRSEVGYVQVDEQRLVSGSAARSNAWLQPQFSYNQHWRQLDQRPLKQSRRWARNHADMAFAQLRQVLDGIDQPDLVLSVPASLNDGQLALLLGLLKALPARVCGIIDSALLGAVPNCRAVIELQQHQTLISHLTSADGELLLARHELLSDLGALAIQRDIARQLSDQLIVDTRYDPLHSSASQQALHDALPTWLAPLAIHAEYLTELPSPQGLLALRMVRAQLQQVLTPRTATLARVLQSYAGEHLAIAPAGELLSIFSPELKAVEVISTTVLANRGLALGRAWQYDPPPLGRLQSLTIAIINASSSRAGSAPAVGDAQPLRSPATHLLYRDRAWSLDRGLSFNLVGEHLKIALGQLAGADVSLISCATGLQLIAGSGALEVQLPARNSCGEWLQIGAFKLALIEVIDA